MKKYIKSSRAIQDERIDYLLSNGWEMGYGTSPMNRATEVYFKEFTDPESGKYVRVVINPSDYFQISAGYSDGWKAKFDDNVPSHLHRGRYRDELSVIEKAAQDALYDWLHGDDVTASELTDSQERRFRDTESGEIITIDQLKQEYEELKASGETEAENFSDYLTNCLDQDGFLEEIKASYDVAVSDNMDLAFGILVRNDYTGRYGIIRFPYKGTAKRWYTKLLDNAGNRYTQKKAMQAGEFWEDVSPDDIDENGIWTRRPFDFGIVLLNPDDAIIFDEWGT
jgi:hypothetical protein